MVHQGLEDWLFLTGGSNFVIHLYQRDDGHLPDAALARWADAVVDRKARCEAMGIVYAHLVAPEKITVYGHRLARPLVDVNLAPAIRFAQALADRSAASVCVDLVGPMRSRRDEIDLYWRTDTHWTPEGFRLAYETLSHHLQLTPQAALGDRRVAEAARLMDLGAKLDPPVWEQIREVNWLRDATRLHINGVARLLEDPAYGGAIHVGSRAIFRNPKAPNKARLMLFGDSFSGVGAHALTALLAETVEHVDFIWAASVDWRLVQREKPDILVTEMAERYMAIPPRADFSLRRTEVTQRLTGRRRQFEAWLRGAKTRFQPSMSRP
jgi:alginate O-acetyltransferase complex protein AlgJ